MTDTRWHEVKALFHAVLERPPDERATFLAAAACGDDALRREVESLLRSDNSDADFMHLLPVSDPASLSGLLEALPLSNDANRTEARITAGTNIGSYRVMGPLGAGGMGEVYRARDSKLNRDVALKLLPAEFEFDRERLARFRREAQVLAALNHPHIAAIYGLDESNGRQALVLELVEGATVAERIVGGALPLREALTLARQIAAALEAAHEKGIVHRDLKPANIKVTPAGVVKVLDFGLAKTTERDVRESVLSSVPTMADGTRVGVIVGTAAYMSPEQARGQNVDTRTDIWAFGCVLFELLAGRKAFTTLERDPDWSALPKTTPAKVRHLLAQCLQKDPLRRLQTIAEARIVIDGIVAPRALSRPQWFALGTVATLLLSGGVYLWWRIDQPPLASRSDWVQLTNLDSVTQPALSPDGRMLAFIRGPGTFVSPGQLYVKQLPNGEPVQLTHDDLPKMGPVFSPGGNRIAYTVNDGNSWDTWNVPTLRGEPRHWLRNASGLSWIGESDLLFSEVKSGVHMAIVRSPESRLGSRDLYVPADESGMAHHSQASPDDKWVLVVEMGQNGVWSPCRLLTIDGGFSRVVGPSRARCTSAAWAPDGRWMYFSADAGDGFHVWRQRFPDGQPEQLTSGPTEEEGLSIAPDGKSLVTSVGLAQRSVWFHDASGERQISLEGYAFWPLLSADGRKVCFRVTHGVASGQSPSELWVTDLVSGESLRLFPGQMITGYDVSHDDRIVAAVAEDDGHTRLWLTSIDGRDAPRRLDAVEGDNPRFGRDDEILFRFDVGRTGFLGRVRENGEDRKQVAEVGGAVFGTASPDGEWLSSIGAGSAEMRVYSTSGQPSVRIFPYTQTSRLRWSRDGKYVYLSVQYGQASAFATGRTYILHPEQGSMFPHVPPGGFRTEAEISALPGVVSLPYGDVAPGAKPSVYAFSRVTTTRNLYRIPVQ